VPSDVWRYFLLANRPEGGDTQFLWRDFIMRNNGELLNNLGNFVNRALKFINAKYDSVLPDPATKSGSKEDYLAGELEADLTKEVNTLLESYIKDMESLKLRSGLDTVMRISQRGNVYLQKADLSNDLFTNHPERCATVVLTAANLIYLLSVLAHPFMPATSASILQQLDLPPRSVPETFTIDLFPGHTIGKADYLFKRIDGKMEDVWRKQFGGRGAGSDAPPPAVSAKQAKKLAKQGKSTAPAFAGEKPPEMVVLEGKIAEQGERVRLVKAGEGKEGDVLAVEVASLLSLKTELQGMIDRLANISV
jgi:methionyl-tRNA synthetase